MLMYDNEFKTKENKFEPKVNQEPRMAWRQNTVYIEDLIQPYTPTRQLRSSSKKLLVTPKSNLKFYGDRSFQVAAPRL